MYKKLFLSLSLPLLLFAEIADDDMDGVENSIDRCPNSLMTDIVDATGCSVETLTIPTEHHFDIAVGYGYSKLDSNISQQANTLSFNYYYGENLSLSFYTSTYTLQSGESGSDDSSLQVRYNHLYHDIFLDYTLGVYLPTYSSSDNKSDYYLKTSLSYSFEYFDTSLLLQHTFMQDNGTQDTNLASISIGTSYHDKLYTTLSYTLQSAIYTDIGNLEDIACNLHYTINEDFFLFAYFSKGISDSSVDQSLSFSLGYSY